jgi:hypothetical protein
MTSFNLRRFEETSAAGDFPISASAVRPSLPRGAFITSLTSVSPGGRGSYDRNGDAQESGRRERFLPQWQCIKELLDPHICVVTPSGIDSRQPNVEITASVIGAAAELDRKEASGC